MDKLKLKLSQLKGFLGKYSRKTKILAGVVAVLIIGGAVTAALVLNHKEYTTLFSGVTEEEAASIIGKLQESGVAFQYKGDGVILVSEDVADQTRANLAYEGYPKSGFSYDIFTENAGGMTTDTEKEMYKLYELQDRIGATIRLFDGVKDAKVTIALGSEQKYVLEKDNENNEPSASVVVTMEGGDSFSEKQAKAVQRLVAKSVPDMELDNVAVFDGNGLEVSTGSDGSAASSGNAAEEIAQLIETQISNKIVNVLSPFYGSENIRVSARGKVNMEKVIRETTTYSTPEKIDEEDKTGIVSNESEAREYAGSGLEAGGVAGSESNADTPEYNADTDEETAEGLISESQTRDYLVNQVKEQGELDPGVLEDLTVSVSINGEGTAKISDNQLKDLIGNATGIAAADRREKITIVTAPFYEAEEEGPLQEVVSLADTIKDNFPVIIVAAVLALLLVIAAVILIRRRRRKRLREEEEEENFLVADLVQEENNPEILNLRNEKSRELRENVRDFAEENPEISAQMIRNWLNGGETDGNK